MDTNEILKGLVSLVKKLCYKDGVDYDSITLKTNLVSDLGLDSIQIIMMAIGIEKEFDVVIQNVDFSMFKEVGDVVNYVGGQLDEDM